MRAVCNKHSTDVADTEEKVRNASHTFGSWRQVVLDALPSGGDVHFSSERDDWATPQDLFEPQGRSAGIRVGDSAASRCRVFDGLVSELPAHEDSAYEQVFVFAANGARNAVIRSSSLSAERDRHAWLRSTLAAEPSEEPAPLQRPWVWPSLCPGGAAFAEGSG